jgi:predicted nucleic acid-binding Zn ribbon protein
VVFLKRRHEVLAEIQTALARQDERLTVMERTLQRIDRAVYGNGEDGLRAQMADHCRRLEEIEGCHEREEEVAKAGKDEWRKFRLGLFAAFILLVVEVVLSILGVL